MVTGSTFLAPSSADEAIARFAELGPDLVLLGGGTIVMGAINEGKCFPRVAMSLANAGMSGINQTNGAIEIGAMTSVRDVVTLPGRSALTDAAATMGGPALRNMATIGGNLFASPPAGDLGVALLALDAEVEIVGRDGRRWQSLETFFAERGEATFSPPAIVTRVRLPPVAGQSLFRKLGRRQASSPAVVAVAVRIDRDAEGVCRDARIAIGAAGPAPTRAKQAEQLLIGQRLDDGLPARAGDAAMAASHPATDALASDWYRKRMVGVVVRQMLGTLIAA